MTARLGIEPSQTQLAGSAPRRAHGWFLSTEGRVDSKDARDHIDWLLDVIEPVSRELAALFKSGARIDVSCFWVAAHGHGGPMLSPSQMQRLASLGLACWFDVYAGQG